MKLSKIVDLLNARIITSNYNPDIELYNAFSGDLMSDALMILRCAPLDFCEHGMMITGNASIHSVKTAEILDFRLLIISRGKQPTQDVIDYALEAGIIMIGTDHFTFTSSGILYQHGIRNNLVIKK